MRFGVNIFKFSTICVNYFQQIPFTAKFEVFNVMFPLKQFITESVFFDRTVFDAP